MKSIRLSTPKTDEDWSRRFVDDTDYDVLLDEDTRVERPDGSTLLVLRKNALTAENVGAAWKILRPLKINSDNRGSASGIKAKGRKKGDGTTSKTIRVPKGWGVDSAIIGYFERTVRMPYCRACAWNLNSPEKFAKLFPLIQEVDALFRECVPDRYAVQKGFADRTPPDFVIPGTAFTTITVNKNFRTACHQDAGDLEEGFSCLSLIREGSYRGGNLVLPAWRIAARLDTRDVIFFDAHEFHGNTQIVPLSPDAQRCSLVYYYRTKMVDCRSAAEELEQVKNRRPGQPLFGDR